MPTHSLVPRPRLPKLRTEGLVSTDSRMHQLFPNNWETVYLQFIYVLHWRQQQLRPVIYRFRLAMANVNFAQAVDYALQRLWAIEAIYNGRDVFVWLPTGFGKSICFQAPSNSNLFLATAVGGRHLLVLGETTLALLAFVLFSDTCCTDLSKANWEDFASSLQI